MTRKLTALALALILAPALLGLQECSAFNEEVTAPGARGACSAPASVSAVVSPRECIAGNQNVTCIADYSMAADEGDVISWTFNGGTPPDSEAVSGAVRWITQSGPPMTVSWRATRCTCDPQRDPDRDSCKSQDGNTSFTAQG